MRDPAQKPTLTVKAYSAWRLFVTKNDGWP